MIEVQPKRCISELNFGYMEVYANSNSIKKLGLPFYGADQQVQIRTYEGYRYCDIIIWEKRNKPFCNIKLKLPFGFSPYDLYVIKDAERKATENIEGPQSPYFGTWNLNEFVLWNTTDRRAANLWERRIKPYKIIEIKSKDDLETSEFEKRILKCEDRPREAPQERVR